MKNNFTRRQFLKACTLLAAATACNAVPVTNPFVPTPTPTNTPEPTNTPAPTATPTAFPSGLALRERARLRNFIYGAALNATALADAAMKKNFFDECGILTAENELKFAALRSNAADTDKFDFSKADALYNFAKDNNILFRGHTLIWHNQLPAWFDTKVNKQTAPAMLMQHIRVTMAHYTGKVHSWDVVNEAVNPADKRPDGLRKTKWLDLVGDDYIDLAFRTAADTDSKTILTYNDFGVELDNPDHQAKREAILKMLTRLVKEKKTPIQALGIQAHLDGELMKTQFNADKFKKFLSEVAALGLKIMITELDVTDQKLAKELAVRDVDVAEAYRKFLTAALAEPQVSAVLTWGLSDKFTWLSTQKARTDGAKVRPLPLDEEFKRKLAWDAMAEVFEKAPKR